MTLLLTYKTCSTTKVAYKMIAAIRESSTDIIMGCAIPDYGALQQYELLEFRSALFSKVITQYKELFCIVASYLYMRQLQPITSQPKNYLFMLHPRMFQHITAVK